MVRRSGRRPGKQDTRETILASARTAFAERGYDGASIRHIASEAGVDPALVHHYFGTKEKLFASVMSIPIDPGALIPEIFGDGGGDGDWDGVAERLVRTFVSVWSGAVSGPAIQAVLRSAISHPQSGALVREFFTTQILRRILIQLGDRVDTEEIPLRVSLVWSQMFGLAVTRYLLEVEPLASQSDEDVVGLLTPTVHHYLFGNLTEDPGAIGLAE